MPRTIWIAAALATVACSNQVAQPPPPPASGLQAQLERAAREFGVPAPLLIGAAWVQTRLSMNAGQMSLDHGYGLFHLLDRADAPDASSLQHAARLTGASPDALKSDAQANARGFAALMREQADLVFGQYKDLDENKLGDWYEVMMLVSGLPEGGPADDFAAQIYSTLRSGLVAAADDGSVVRLSPQSFDLSGVAMFGQIEQGSSGDYCPNGCVNFVPASTSNYTAGRGTPITMVVIHDMEGSYASAIAWFQNPSAQASAHYDIRSSDGQITQQVHNADTAWHAGDWNTNQHSIGIEHEGYAASGSTWFTEAMYKSSAALTRWITDKYGIPKDRNHIIGHYEVPNPNHAGWYGGADAHHDPCMTWAGSPTWHNVTGCQWDWTHYMSLVIGSAPPATTGILTGFVGDNCCGVTAGTRQPLVGATVVVGSQTVHTDSSGMYSFTLAPGTYKPVASATGYVSGDHSSIGNGTSADISVAAGGTSWGSILLAKQVVVHAPAVTIASPANNATVTTANVTVSGSIDDHSVTSVKVNSNNVAASNGTFSTSVALIAGRNTITVTATNAGGTGQAQVVVTYNAPPPAASGVSGVVTDSKTGAAIASATVAVHGGGTSAQSDAAGHYQLALSAGSYSIDFSASGYVSVSHSVTIVGGQIATLGAALDPTTAPPPLGHVAIALPTDGLETGDDTVLVMGRATLADLAAVTIDDAPATVDADGNFQGQVKLAPGANTITVKATNKSGQSVTGLVRVTYTPPAPDPGAAAAATGCSTTGSGGFAAFLLAGFALMLRRRAGARLPHEFRGLDRS